MGPDRIMRHFLEEYGGVVIAVVIAIVVLGAIFAFLPLLKDHFDVFVSQMMQ